MGQNNQHLKKQLDKTRGNNWKGDGAKRKYESWKAAFIASIEVSPSTAE